jgi:hypothetical protein
MKKIPRVSAAASFCVVLFLMTSPHDAAAAAAVSLADEDVRRTNASDVTGVHHHDHGSANAQSEDQLTDEASRAFLRLLFDKYGERSAAAAAAAAADGGEPMTGDMTMTFEGFEHLLDSLGLGDVRIADHGIEDHRRPSTGAGSGAARFHKLHEHDELGRHQQRLSRNPDSGIDKNATGFTGVEKTAEARANSDAHSHRRRRETTEIKNTQRTVDGRRPSSSTEKLDKKSLTEVARREKRESPSADKERSSLVISDSVIVLPKVSTLPTPEDSTHR